MFLFLVEMERRGLLEASALGQNSLSFFRTLNSTSLALIAVLVKFCCLVKKMPEFAAIKESFPLRNKVSMSLSYFSLFYEG